MAWFRRNRDKGRHEPGAPEEARAIERATFGAGPTPRFDSGGRPIVEFTPAVREALGFDGTRVGLAEVYRSQPNVRICVDFLSLNIAHCKLKVYRKRGDERVEVEASHPLVQVLDNPNGVVSGFELIRDTIADLAIYANAYWVRREVEDQVALVRVHPIYVEVKGGSPVTGPSHYIIDAGGGPVRIELRDMVHFKLYNPEDGRVGISPLESLRWVLAEERAASKHRVKFWRNAARQEGWIKRPENKPWTPEQRKEFRDEWQQAMSGTDNAGKTAILEDGMELHDHSFSPRDSEFIPGREFSLDLCATTYQIPLAVLSRKNTATFASIKEFRSIVYVDTLGSWMALMERAINNQLIPAFQVRERLDQSLFVEFNIEEKLQGDFETQAEALRRAIHVPYMAVNEARALRNLPRIPDADFDKPAKATNYTYATAPAPPQVIRSVPDSGEREAALAPDVLLDLEQLEESTNGYHA